MTVRCIESDLIYKFSRAKVGKQTNKAMAEKKFDLWIFLHARFEQEIVKCYIAKL